jgi:transposase
MMANIAAIQGCFEPLNTVLISTGTMRIPAQVGHQVRFDPDAVRRQVDAHGLDFVGLRQRTKLLDAAAKREHGDYVAKQA